MQAQIVSALPIASILHLYENSLIGRIFVKNACKMNLIIYF